MSKLSRKFMGSLAAILLTVILVSLYLNANFIQGFFLYQEKKDLNHICDTIVASGEDLTSTIDRLEKEEDLVIVQVQNSDDNVVLNKRIREAFLDKGLSFQKFWLWDENQKTIAEKGRKLKIYEQKKLSYSLLVEYVQINENFLAVAKIIPAVERTISLINFVTACVFFTATLMVLLLISILVKRITAPLMSIGEAAKAIANLDFRTVHIKTGDELEVLAQDINNMSHKLKAAHEALESKNRQMESLLANVSHDLKTPISLIKAYTSGIKDGMDDGTFLDTIILQNEKMELMIQRLLDLTKLQQQEVSMEPVNFCDLLRDIASEYQLQAEERQLLFTYTLDPDIIQTGNKEAIQTIFSNLISNAVKYSSGGPIHLTLKNCGKTCLFEIQNLVNPEAAIEPERLWEPFYVGEQSRNKSMSGTGLGLSIVRTTAQKYGYECSCDLLNGQIRFTVIF